MSSLRSSHQGHRDHSIISNTFKTRVVYNASNRSLTCFGICTGYRYDSTLIKKLLHLHIARIRQGSQPTGPWGYLSSVTRWFQAANAHSCVILITFLVPRAFVMQLVLKVSKKQIFNTVFQKPPGGRPRRLVSLLTQRMTMIEIYVCIAARKAMFHDKCRSLLLMHKAHQDSTYFPNKHDAYADSSCLFLA